MPKLTSRERRASIILIILGCGLIFSMALIKGLSAPAPAALPAIETPSQAADTIASSAASRHKSKSDTTRAASRRPANRRQRPQALEGRSRDFLSEPVPSR